MTKFVTWLVFLAAPALPLLGETTTYQLPPSGCVHITNCIVNGPAESYSLWEEVGANGQSWQIFNVYSWVGGFSVVDTYHCNSAAYHEGPAGNGAPAGSTTEITASCSGVDTKGGGGAGTRWWVTGGSVTITE